MVLIDGQCFNLWMLDILFYFILKRHHFGFCKKRFAVTGAQIIGNLGESWRRTANLQLITVEPFAPSGKII